MDAGTPTRKRQPKRRFNGDDNGENHKRNNQDLENIETFETIETTKLHQDDSEHAYRTPIRPKLLSSDVETSPGIEANFFQNANSSPSYVTWDVIRPEPTSTSVREAASRLTQELKDHLKRRRKLMENSIDSDIYDRNVVNSTKISLSVPQIEHYKESNSLMRAKLDECLTKMESEKIEKKQGETKSRVKILGYPVKLMKPKKCQENSSENRNNSKVRRVGCYKQLNIKKPPEQLSGSSNALKGNALSTIDYFDDSFDEVISTSTLSLDLLTEENCDMSSKLSSVPTISDVSIREIQNGSTFTDENLSFSGSLDDNFDDLFKEINF